jgi:hypothetical protein
MIRAPVNRRNITTNTKGNGQNTLNVSNHGLLNISGHGSNGLNLSGHSCCSSTTRGGNNNNYADVSLSNIFADEEERIDIFGENSMVGFITALQIERNGKSERQETCCQYQHESFERPAPQKKINSMKSMKTIGTDSTSTWQGSCNSFIGMGDELLDLSFTVNDFDKGNDDLSLHAKKTVASPASQSKMIPRNLSRKDIQLNNFKKERTPAKAIGSKRSLQPKGPNALVVTGGGMHHCFTEENGKSNADQSPRKPVRRCEEDETLQPEDEAATGRQKLKEAVVNLSKIIDVPNMNVDEESSSSEVIKINVAPISRSKEGDESSDRADCGSFATVRDQPSLSLPCTTSIAQSTGEVSSKEDSAPKCPRRGASPTRSVIAELRDRSIEKPTSLSSNKVNDSGSSFTHRVSETSTTEYKSPPSPRKKVMMIAIKDLEKYVSDKSETDGKIQKAAISANRYKKIMKAAEEKQLHRNDENERVKISKNAITGSDGGASPHSTKMSIPKSIAVDCSDRSLSSMDDSSRPFIHENRSPLPGIVTATRRKNNLFKWKSNRSVTSSPSSSKRNATTNVRTNPKTIIQKSSASPKARKIMRASSCVILTEPTTDANLDLVKTSSNSGRKFTRSSSCIFGKSKTLPQKVFDTSVDIKNDVPEKPSRLLKKLRRVSSCCDIVSEGQTRIANNSKNTTGTKTRYDSPIIRPTTSVASPPGTTNVSVSSPHRQQHVNCAAVVGGDGKSCYHHHRDKPPTSPRRYITPTRATSIRSRSK